MTLIACVIYSSGQSTEVPNAFDYNLFLILFVGDLCRHVWP
jgi:hypothetical protein